MYRLILPVLLLLITLLLTASCSSIPKTSSTDFKYHKGVSASTYFPLNKDNSWTYETTISDPGGLGERRETSISKVVARNGDVFSLSNGSDILTYELSANGLLRLPSKNPMVPYPVAEKAEWKVKVGEIGGVGVVASVDEKVITKAGLFDHCLLVEERYPSEAMLIRRWFAPNVGLVRMQTVLVDGEIEKIAINSELRIYLLH